MSQYNAADKTKLSDQEWGAIAAQLKTIGGIYRSQSTSCRRFIEAVLWVLRVGGQWRCLPADRGNWSSVYKRFARWSPLACGTVFSAFKRMQLIFKTFPSAAPLRAPMRVPPGRLKVAQTMRRLAGRVVALVARSTQRCTAWACPSGLFSPASKLPISVKPFR